MILICRVSTGSKIDFLSNKFIIFGLIKVIYHFWTKTKKNISTISKNFGIFFRFFKLSGWKKSAFHTFFLKKNFYQKSYNFISFLKKYVSRMHVSTSFAVPTLHYRLMGFHNINIFVKIWKVVFSGKNSSEKLWKYL